MRRVLPLVEAITSQSGHGIIFGIYNARRSALNLVESRSDVTGHRRWIRVTALPARGRRPWRRRRAG